MERILRKVGSLENSEKADIFRWYLVSQGVDTQVEGIEENSCDIWIIHDRDWQKSRTFLSQFLSAPDPGVYQKHATEGRKQWKKKVSPTKTPVEVKARTQLFHHAASPRQPNATYALIACSAIYFLLNFLDRDRWLFRHLMISENFLASSFGIRSFREISHGQIWRLVTPIFIHSDFFHIAFNMIWLYQFGRVIEGHIRTLPFLLLVFAIAAPSNLAFYLVAGPFFGGMSGVVYGLFFFSWAYDRFSPSSPFRLDPYLFKFFLVYYVLCWLLSAFGFHIANTIHGVGALTGLVIGYLASGHFQNRPQAIKVNKNFIYNTLIIFALLSGGILADIFTR